MAWLSLSPTSIPILIAKVQMCWLVQTMYPFGLGVIKISVLFLYHELFPSDNFRTIIFCAMGFISAMTMACTLAFVFQCTPVRAYWVMSMWDERYCVNGGAIFTASAVLSMVTDIFILALPLRFLLGNFCPDCVTCCVITDLSAVIRIYLRGKIQLILLMSLGGL